MNALVTILGDGQMALVLADALIERGAKVRIWCPLPGSADSLCTNRGTERLPGFRLPAPVMLTEDPSAAMDGATAIINAIPTQFMRDVWKRVGRYAPPDVPVFCVSKGIENETLLTPIHIIADVLGPNDDRSMCALSGPTIAAELARRMPATMVAASENVTLSELAQDLFNVSWLRIYRNDDPLGVELAGATKNVIALAAGMVDGLNAGDNAKSALLARGLAEIARLGTSMGARVDTFFGVAGVGDLATTCFSPSGRNRTCGERLGRGEKLDDILASTRSVVEGVATTKSVHALAQRHGVEMPITEAVYAVLFENLALSDAMQSLMQREAKAERIG